MASVLLFYREITTIRLLIRSDDLHGHFDDVLLREAELLEEQVCRCRGAEALHADRRTVKADVAAPAKARERLDCDARTDILRQDALLILLALLLEEIHARHRDDADVDAALAELFLCLDGQRYFRARADQDAGHVRRILGFRDDVSALERFLARARQLRQVLAREYESRRRLRGSHSEVPASSRLRRISRTEDVEVRQRTQHGELLDWLMRWAILADTNAVVRQDVRRRQMHERCEAHHRLHVITEDEERRDVSAQATVQHQAVLDSCHGELADAEVQVAARIIRLAEVALAIHMRLVGRCEVGTAADEVRQDVLEEVDLLAGKSARCDSFLFLGPECIVVVECLSTTAVWYLSQRALSSGNFSQYSANILFQAASASSPFLAFSA